MMPLFFDPQDAPVIGYCSVCGGEIYAGDGSQPDICFFCREEGERANDS